MKNYEQILSDAGVTLTDEQKESIKKEMEENYKTISDWEKQRDRADGFEKTLKDTQEKLKAFDGVDPAALNQEIANLKADLETKDKEHQAQIADRDFHDMVKCLIAEKKGKNEKAIMALLNVDELKASTNQKEDVAQALDALVEAEDSSMLFGEAAPPEVGGGNPIGTVTKSGGANDLASLRASFGLPAESK